MRPTTVGAAGGADVGAHVHPATTRVRRIGLLPRQDLGRRCHACAGRIRFASRDRFTGGVVEMEPRDVVSGRRRRKPVLDRHVRERQRAIIAQCHIRNRVDGGEPRTADLVALLDERIAEELLRPGVEVLAGFHGGTNQLVGHGHQLSCRPERVVRA